MNTNINEVLNCAINMNTHKANTYSPLALAYIGDGVYELFVRTYVLSKGNMPVNKMHRASRELVRAGAQAKLYHLVEEQLTEEELQVLKRGRNAKSISAPKNADVTEYRHATGLEALIGYLYLEGKIDRIQEIIQLGFESL
ncbi:MAG: ribonuclease III domain-containing protein [Niameybacter sp.]